MEACNSCAVVIANGDTTHIENDDTRHTVETTLEGLGLVTAELADEGATFFRCDICDNNTMSEVYTVEAV